MSLLDNRIENRFGHSGTPRSCIWVQSLFVKTQISQGPLTLTLPPPETGAREFLVTPLSPFLSLWGRGVGEGDFTNRECTLSELNFNRHARQ